MGRAERVRNGVAVIGEKLPAAAAAARFTDAELERVHEETRRMNVADRIIYYDKRQADPETRVLCPNDEKHGALGMMGSGSMMICGARKGGAWCTGSMPVSA